MFKIMNFPNVRISTEIGSLLLAYSFTVLFLLLHFEAVDYRGVASSFPVISLRVGILLSVIISITETLSYFKDENNVETGNKYLRGTTNNYGSIEQTKRVCVTTLGIGIFLLIWHFDLILALATSYIFILYLLGVESIRKIAIATGSLLIFIFVVFILALGVPIGVV